MMQENRSSVSQPPKKFLVPLVWTVEDVARELGCSTRTVRRLVAENLIPHSRVGRLVKFLPGKIQEWLVKGGTAWS